MKPDPSDSLVLQSASFVSQKLHVFWQRQRTAWSTIPVRSIVSIWLFWVVFIHLIPSLTSGVLPSRNPNNETTIWPYFMEAIQTSLSRWDSRWFHEVVERGYFYYGPTKLTSVQYYPLYPLLVRLVRAITPFNTFQAGTIVSALATLGSLLLLCRAAAKDSTRATGMAAVEAQLLFPSAFILATVYSDSTTLFCFLLATHLARTKAYIAAGVVAFASALTHFSGFLILLPLVVITGKELRTLKSSAPWIMVGLGLVGTIAFPGYLWYRFGDPLLHFHVQADRSFVPFYTFLKDVLLATISALTDHKVPQVIDPTGMSTFPVNCAVLCLMFWTLRASYLRRRWDDVALMLGACLLASSAGTLQSLARLALVYYPISLRLGELFVEKPTIRFILSFTFLSGQILMLTLFVRWFFAF